MKDERMLILLFLLCDIGFAYFPHLTIHSNSIKYIFYNSYGIEEKIEDQRSEFFA